MMNFKRRNATTGSKVSGSHLGTGSQEALDRLAKKKKDHMMSSESAGPGNIKMGNIPTGIDSDPMLEGMDYDLEDRVLFDLYKDIYYHDPIAGCTVDMYSTLPFSEFTLSGGTEKDLQPYREAIELLQLRTAFPEITVDYKVTGAFLGSLIYNKQDKNFVDLMTHRYADAEVKPLPFYSQDPIINLTIPDDIKKTLQIDSPRIAALRERLGGQFLEHILGGSVELDPLGTLYVPRKQFTFDRGVSYFRRILPIWLIEKNLYRGTLIESGKRQRGILHLQMGDGEQWEPTQDDMEYITDLFMNADADPLGAVVATRLGVSIDEFRQGGDFWKITDIWDQTTTFKLRALGVSEAFLSGDANYSCITGDSLIQTRSGLLRIGEMVNHDPINQVVGEPVEIQETLAGRYTPVKSAVWIYSGYQDVFRIESTDGYHITGTDKHPTLVFNPETGTTEWRNILEVSKGDLVCVNTKKLGRKEDLFFDLDYLPQVIQGGKLKELDAPIKMTTELAWLFGAVTAEGNVGKNSITFSNSDPEFINTFISYMDVVFGVECGYGLKEPKGTRHVINGVESFTNHDHYYVKVNSQQIASWFDSLGMKKGATSKIKQIPWSILQAPVECQYAFVAAFAEGDGHFRKDQNCFSLFTFSPEMRSEFQTMITSMGVPCKQSNRGVSVSGNSARLLYIHIRKYLVSKSITFTDEMKARKLFGIPAEYYLAELRDRKVSHSRHGAIYLDDNGNEVEVTAMLKNIPEKRFLYDAYERGHYEHFLECLEKVSLSMHSKLMELFNCRYHFTSVTSVTNAGKDHVYDISVEKGNEPAFVANGMVIHNTMEGSLTVFVESMRMFRDMMTRKVMYDKLFPLVAMLNGKALSKKGKVISKSGMMSGGIESVLRTMQDGSRLFIPNVHWSKQLKPEGDQGYMEMLRTMQEAGIPVPLRAMAAAGGFNLDTLLSQQAEDLALQRSLHEYQSRVDGLKKEFGGGGGGDEEGGFGGFSSVSNSLNSITGQRGRSRVLNGRKQSILNRDYGETGEIIGRSKTDKPKYIHNQKAAQAKQNENIYKSMMSISKNKMTPLSHRTQVRKED